MKKFTEFQVELIKKGLWDLRDSLLNRTIALLHNHDSSSHDWCMKQVDTWHKTVDEIDSILNSDFNGSDENSLNFLVVRYYVDTTGEEHFIPVASFQSEELACDYVNYMSTISDGRYLIDL